MPKRKAKRRTKSKKVSMADVPNVGKQDSSINIEKIENGMLVRVSKYVRNRYVSKTFFAKNEAEVKQIVAKAL